MQGNWGIREMIAATNLLCKQFQIREGTVTHGVDNDAALSNCFGPFELSTLTPCFHIIKRIRAEIKNSPIAWIGKKVKAHQDKHAEVEQLDCWAKGILLAQFHHFFVTPLNRFPSSTLFHLLFTSRNDWMSNPNPFSV